MSFSQIDSTNDESGVVGGSNSQFGYIQLGFDPDYYTSVDWFSEVSPDTMGESEQYFGLDEGGRPIVLTKDAPSALSAKQLQQTIENGIIVLEGARFAFSLGIHIFDFVVITDSGAATVKRGPQDSVSFSDTATAPSRLASMSRLGRGSMISAMQPGRNAYVGNLTAQVGLRSGDTVDTVPISDAATHSPHS